MEALEPFRVPAHTQVGLGVALLVPNSTAHAAGGSERRFAYAKLHRMVVHIRLWSKSFFIIIIIIIIIFTLPAQAGLWAA